MVSLKNKIKKLLIKNDQDDLLPVYVSCFTPVNSFSASFVAFIPSTCCLDSIKNLIELQLHLNIPQALHFKVSELFYKGVYTVPELPFIKFKQVINEDTRINMRALIIQSTESDLKREENLAKEAKEKEKDNLNPKREEIEKLVEFMKENEMDSVPSYRNLCKLGQKDLIRDCGGFKSVKRELELRRVNSKTTGFEVGTKEKRKKHENVNQKIKTLNRSENKTPKGTNKNSIKIVKRAKKDTKNVKDRKDGKDQTHKKRKEKIKAQGEEKEENKEPHKKVSPSSSSFDSEETTEDVPSEEQRETIDKVPSKTKLKKMKEKAKRMRKVRKVPVEGMMKKINVKKRKDKDFDSKFGISSDKEKEIESSEQSESREGSQ